MLRALLFSICIVVITTAHGQLSETADISILTCGPSNGELYAAFGHTAIHIKDSVTGINIVCDYGAFDFEQTNFYWNFAKGFLNYKFIIEEYEPFKRAYITENRYVHESYLDLTGDQKQKLYSYLQQNSLPQNREYRYDYFYNNCSTKIRDALVVAMKGEVQFVLPKEIGTENTFRSLTDVYLKNHPWSDLGIDICLGAPSEQKVNGMEYMFLPANLELALDHAMINTGGSDRKLVHHKTIWFDPNDQSYRPGSAPLITLCVVLAIAVMITLYDFKRGTISYRFDAILLVITGLIGFLLLFLWFGTDHKATAGNLNLVWALPTNFFMAFVLKKTWTWIRFYFLGVALLSGTFLLLWNWLPQDLNTALLPLIAALFIRAIAQGLQNRKRSNNSI
ncbi:MAG: DUF4105 domain-containing protein [Chryseolinea sp.]